mmetsp:Transcript_17788/g.41448  ORF Transcript_17788/g.41448 Transcript_17788/m.41448 type:complete len:683 (-) Transcript_17788:55-2103(-)
MNSREELQLHEVEDDEEDDMDDDDDEEDDEDDEDMLGDPDDDEGVEVMVQRYLAQPIDIQRLVPAFADANDTREVLTRLCDVMRRINAQESPGDVRSDLRFRMQQGLAYAQACPTPENGHWLRNYEDLLRKNLELREGWPTRPIMPDPRSGTLMEGVEHFAFEHEAEGLIHLKWVNPVAKPDWLTEGLLCDSCGETALKAGYQVITEDSSRDMSSFIQDRIGFDVCANCAHTHIKERRNGLRQLFSEVPRCTQRRGRTIAGGCNLPMSLSMNITSFGGSSSSSKGSDPTLVLDLSGTAGFCVSACALPQVQCQDASASSTDMFPSCWLSTGRVMPALSRMNSTDSTQDVRQEACTVEFKCARGSTWLVQRSEGSRGSLSVARIQSGSDEEDGERPEENPRPPVKALILSESEFTSPDGSAKQVLPYIRFHGAAGGVWLPPSEDTQSILHSLQRLAASAGVMTNLPRQQEGALVEASATSSGSAMVLDNSNADGNEMAWENAISGHFPPPAFASTNHCMICLYPLSEDTWLRGAPVQTSCGHSFHSICLRKHCRAPRDGVKQTCPVCRSQDPLNGAKYLEGDGAAQLHATLKKDAFGQPFQEGRCYHIVAMLCHDLQAVVDTSLVIECATLQLGDDMPCMMDEDWDKSAPSKSIPDVSDHADTCKVAAQVTVDSDPPPSAWQR